MGCIIMYLLEQITISDKRSKWVNENIKRCAHSHNTIFIHANFNVNLSFGFHYNVFLELIMISNPRNERVNENITTLCTYQH